LVKVFSKLVEIKTFGPMVLHPLRNILERCINESDIENGVLYASVEGATPALVILERGLESLFINFLTKFIPFTGWEHGNAYAHLISTLLSTNLVIPIENYSLALNSSTEVYLLETRSVHNHSRSVAVEIHGVQENGAHNSDAL